MSTQSILSGIGFVVGSYFGYPQLGLLVGSLVGAALTPATKTQGPRIDDQKVTVSTYGAGIPIAYGNVRLGGNVVDSTDKIEVGTTTAQGKGGGTENTSYKYFVHMAVALCATPSDGSLVTIRRIWKDGKLIYDTSSGIPIGSALASATSPYSFLVMYQGGETQMPDPLEELQHGIGNVPAYRGVVRVRLNAVECPGGRVPQFSFEISCGGVVVPTIVYGATTTVPAISTGRSSHSRIPMNGNPAVIFSEGLVDLSGAFPQKTLQFNYVGLDYSSPPTTVALSVDQAANYTAITGHADIDGVCLRQVLATNAVDSGNNIVVELDGTVHTFFTGPNLQAFGQGTSHWAKYGNRFLINSDSINGPHTVGLFNWTSTFEIARTTLDVSDIYLTTSYAWLFYNAAGVPRLQIRSASDFSFLSDTALPSSVSFIAYSMIFTSQSDDTLSALQTGAGSSATLFSLICDALGVLTVTQQFTAVTGIAPTGGYNMGVSAGNVMGAIVNERSTTQNARPYLINFQAVTSAMTSVAGIINDQCSRAGLSLSQIDTSTINDSVWGMTLTNPASARTNIGPLMTAFAIDATEENGVIRFFHRASSTSVATISYTELAAIEDGGTPGDPMPLARMQEADVPRSVAVSYINKDFDYQTSTEKATRQTTVSKLDQTIDLPMSVGADIAATVAQRVLIDAWNERNHRTFKVSRKYAFVSPGDAVTITFQDGTQIDWRLVKVTDTGVLLEWEGVPANGSIYTQVVTGSAGYVPQTISALPSPTHQQILDIPILRDADNNAGIYDAMNGYGPTWNGAELFVGDDAVNVTSRGVVNDMAPIGFAETVLPVWAPGMIDNLNLVTVSIGAATFNSVTRDVLLAGGAEYWAYGAPGRWEIGASSTANSLGSGRYTLSSHLRGLFGTERYTGTHVAGDVFVLLRSVGMLRVNMSVGEIGQSKVYRAVSKGRTPDSAQSFAFVNTGEGLKPLSPISLRRSMVGSDITLTWDRRSRLSMNNLYGTVPLGETSEHYITEFWTAGFSALVGTLTTSTASVTITSAQQTAFGLTPGAQVNVKVRQISDSVGAGHELQATI